MSPSLVFGISATTGNPEMIMPSLLIFVSHHLGKLSCSLPIAAAAALRAYLK